MNPLILVTAIAGVAYYYVKNGKKVGMGADGLSPRRAASLKTLLADVHEPARLLEAAQLFERHGCTSAAKTLRGKATEVRKQAKVAAELVVQGRAGDQNALGTIASIGDQARKGNPRARTSAHLLDVYMKRNPAPPVETVDPELAELAAAKPAKGAWAPGEAPEPEGQPGETPPSMGFES